MKISITTYIYHLVSSKIHLNQTTSSQFLQKQKEASTISGQDSFFSVTSKSFLAADVLQTFTTILSKARTPTKMIQLGILTVLSPFVIFTVIHSLSIIGNVFAAKTAYMIEWCNNKAVPNRN